MKGQDSQHTSDQTRFKLWPFSLILLVVLAAYLRLSYVSYGLPFIYNGDELINFRIIQSMLERRSLDPEFFHYPSLLFYLNLPGQFMFRNIDGQLLPVVSQSMGNGFAPQPMALLTARLTTVVFGIATVVATWRLAKNISLRPPFTILATFLVAASPLLVRHSSYVTPDIIAAFFVTGALAASVSITRSLDWRAYLLAGVMAGLAAATKYNAGLVALTIPAAHFAGHGFQKSAPMVALAAMSAILALFLASPFLLLNYDRAISDFLYEIRHYGSGHPGAEGDTLKTNILWLFREMGWTWVFLAGLTMAKAQWRAFLPIGIFATAYFSLLSLQVVRFDRNLLPILPVIFVLSAAGAQQLSIQVRRWPSEAIIATLFVFAALANPITKTMHDLETYVRDPRAAAREWLTAHTRNGGRIAVDAYAPYLESPTGTEIFGKYSVLSLPMDKLLSMDVVVVRRTGLGRLLDTGESPQTAVFTELVARACDVATFPSPPARPQWTVLTLNCR